MAATAARPDDSLLGCLRDSFAKHAELPALEGEHARLTYRELDRQSAVLAHALGAAGAAAGHIVPLLMRRSPQLVVAQLALLRLGAAYAPIDLSSPPARQQLMVDALKPSIIVTDASTQVPQAPGATVFDVNRAGAHPGAGRQAPWHAAEPGAAAYVMYTSGTTGAPKGVVVPQSGIVRLVRDADFADFRAGARWGFLSSPAFDASTLEIWAPLLNGGCCVVQEHPLPSLDDLAGFLRSHRVTDAWLTSALFNALVEDHLDAFGTLHQLLTGGERVSAQHAKTFLKAWPRVRLINGYGPTENTTFTLCHTITPADTESAAGIPVGRPIRGTVVRVGTQAQETGIGELLAGGRGLALGYLNDAELTRRKFVELDGRRWYRTGDLVHRRSDGIFEFRGRVDRQVKLQGHRIELEEVELLLASCPGVGDAAVVVRGDTAEARHLAACFAGLDGPPPSVERVGEFLTQRLPAAAVPRLLVPMARLPHNINGKLDRAALDELIELQTRGPAQADPHWHTDTERLLAGIWQKCLPSARVHRDANFLTLGGTSLLALQMSAQVRRQLGRDLTPIDVLRFPVLAEQARRIETARPFGNEPAVVAPEDQLPLTQAQQSMLAASQLDASGCAYLVHVALSLAKMPERPALRVAFEALARRHPALRMTIQVNANPTHGHVHERLPLGWWHEHAPLASAPQDLVWPPALLDRINRHLDVSVAGMMRVDIWPVADDTCLLVWTVHHASIDEASVERCLLELDCLLRGSALHPVYGSPLGFAALEKAWTDHDGAREWSRVLVETLAAQQPPLDRPPGAGREIPLPVPAQLTGRLQAACSRWSTTPFAVLLTACGLALQDVFGPVHRFVLTPFSRRLEPELIEPVGYLLDLCFVEAGARPGEAHAETLARVSQSVLQLQRPSFSPHEAIAQAVAREDPLVARHLNAFGFTWRLEPSRTLPFGSGNARLLRVPQQGARFGLALHTALIEGELQCSIEAVKAAYTDGQVPAFGSAFLRRLDALCELHALPTSAREGLHRVEAAPPAADAALAAALCAAWTRWVGTPAASITDSSDFLQCGGNSLTVMRMAAQLRREHGLSVEPGEFLARPTFFNLCRLAAAPARHHPSGCVVVGPMNAARVVILIPGKGGQALGLYALAEHLQRRFGDGHAMVIMDLEAMLLRVPHQQPLWFLHQRMEQLVREVGTQRVAGLVGFSLGGLLALQLAHQFPGGTPPPVWLLDSYAPRTLARSLALRIERRLAYMLLRKPARKASATDEAPVDETDGPTTQASLIEPLWEVIHDQLSKAPADAPSAEVHLVQARQSMNHVGLLWRRRSNGFNPAHYAHWHVHQLDAMHLDLPRSLAAETAALFASGLRWHVAPAEPP